MKELGLDNTEKKDILPFLDFFMHLSSRYPTKIFVKGKNMYILAIVTHFKDFLKVSMLHERITTEKY